MRKAVVALAVALACGLAVAAAPVSGSVASCAGDQGYSYAGVMDDMETHGVTASLTQLADPSVTDGHVAGWIDVGWGSEWIQVGYVTNEQKPTRLYVETTIRKHTSYRELATVRTGVKHKLALSEIKGRESWWRVKVDGRTVQTTRLSGHIVGAEVSGENATSTAACNGYSYGFSNVAVQDANAGAWRAIQGKAFQDRGYTFARLSRTTFVARAAGYIGVG